MEIENWKVGNRRLGQAVDLGMAKGNRMVRGIRSDIWEGLIRESRKSLSVKKEAVEGKVLLMSLSRFGFLIVEC